MGSVWLNGPAFLMLMIREEKTFQKGNLFSLYVWFHLCFLCPLELGRFRLSNLKKSVKSFSESLGIFPFELFSGSLTTVYPCGI